MGEVFGRYELLRRIGVGGMAEVFKAKTFGPEGFVKDVVIKRILPAFSEDPDFVRMFINEARLAARLQHANIVQIFDFNQVDGVYYIAMEYVDGTDLKRVVHRSRQRSMPVPVSMAVHVGVETLKGLHYASTRLERGAPLNLVHRDISPHNLLVSFSGEVKITDFGIAKVTALASATQSGMLKGKLAYMSPEQAATEPLDGRSDIFSLGVVLWELLTGHRPYHGDSEAELIALVRRGAVPAPRELRPEIPEELEAVLRFMLAACSEDRYANAASALGELSRFAQVGDTLDVAAYLRELMPDELLDRSGETELLKEDRVVPAPTDAPTHTRESSDAAAEAVPSVKPVEEAREDKSPDSEGDLQKEDKSPKREGSASRPTPRVARKDGKDRRRIWVGVTCLLVCGFGGWWVTGALSRGESNSSGPLGELRVESDPPGAEIWLDGFVLGRCPVVVKGPAGRSLRVEAKLGQLGATREGILENGRWLLRLARNTSKDRARARAASPGERGERAGGARARARAASPGERGERAGGDSARARAASPGERGERAGGARARARAASPGERGERAKDEHRSADAGRSPEPAPVRRHARRSTPRMKPVVKRGWGLIDVVVWPWARVRIDGHDLGHTPLRAHRLSPGKHLLELRNSELGKRVVMNVAVRSGKRTIVRKNWE